MHTACVLRNKQPIHFLYVDEWSLKKHTLHSFKTSFMKTGKADIFMKTVSKKIFKISFNFIKIFPLEHQYVTDSIAAESIRQFFGRSKTTGKLDYAGLQAEVEIECNFSDAVPLESQWWENTIQEGMDWETNS